MDGAMDGAAAQQHGLARRLSFPQQQQGGRTPKMARMCDAHHWYSTAAARQFAHVPVVRPSSARPLHPAEHSVSHQRALSAARSDIFGLSIADRGHWSIAPYRPTL